MNTPTKGKTADNAITLDDMNGDNNSPILQTVSAEQVDDAVTKQEEALAKCKPDDAPSNAPSVSPSDEDKHPYSDDDDSKLVTPRATKSADGNLTIYGLTGGSTPGDTKVIPIYEAKVTKFKDQDKKKEKMEHTLQYLDTVSFQDDPTFQRVNSSVSYSDVLFLNVKEVEEDDIEPVYFVFHNCKSKPGPGQEEDTMHHTCEECFYDKCCEYMFGPYCVAAVKRYFEENCYIANERDAYVTFKAHLNRRLDHHSFENSTNETIRPTQITRVPKCMREGSLYYAIEWIKWQRAHGPHSEWYAEQRRKRKRAKMAKIAKEQNDNRNYLM